LPTFLHDLHCALRRVTTSLCRGHVDELVTWLCRRTASMQQVADRPEAAANDRITYAWTENIPIWVFLRAPKNRLICFVMRPRST